MPYARVVALGGALQDRLAHRVVERLRLLERRLQVLQIVRRLVGRELRAQAVVLRHQLAQLPRSLAAAPSNLPDIVYALLFIFWASG